MKWPGPPKAPGPRVPKGTPPEKFWQNKRHDDKSPLKVLLVLLFINVFIFGMAIGHYVL